MMLDHTTAGCPDVDNCPGNIKGHPSDEVLLDWDMIWYGNAYTVDGKRLDPTKVQVHRREVMEEQ